MNLIVIRRPIQEDFSPDAYLNTDSSVEPTIDTGEELEQTTTNNPVYLTFDNNILTLTINTFFDNLTFSGTYTMSIPTNTEIAYEVALKKGVSGLDVVSYEIFNYVDRDFGLRTINLDIMKIARIVTNPANDTVIVQLCIPCNDIPGVSNEVLSGKYTSTGILIEKCPWLANRINLLNTKAQMLNTVDLYRSVSYLEAQVDLITRILLSIAPPTELVKSLTLCDEVSVLNIKPMSAIDAEFKVNKTNLRKVQESYYGDLQS